MNDAQISETSWQGEKAIRFSAGGYSAMLIPGMGANLIQLNYEKRGLELLRTPAGMEEFRKSVSNYGIPVLFYPNRIEDGKFTACGKEYALPINEADKNNHIHGFLHKRPWEVSKIQATDSGAAEVECVFSAGPDTDFYKWLPHVFEAKLSYRLSSEGLEQKLAIKNNDKDPLPFGLGFHTAFRIPFRPGGRPEAYRMKLSAGEKWELDSRYLPTGRFEEFDGHDRQYRTEGVPVQGYPFLGHFTAKPMKWGEKPFHGALIEDISEGLCLVYETDRKYKHWVVWNDDGRKGFVCPEPQTWAINAPNLALPEDRTGFTALAPGEIWEGLSTIRIIECVKNGGIEK